MRKVNALFLILVTTAFLVGIFTAPDVEELTYTDTWCAENCAGCHGEE